MSAAAESGTRGAGAAMSGDSGMIRCLRGHFVCSVKAFYDVDSKTPLGIADGLCKACEGMETGPFAGWQPLDTRANMRLVRAYAEGRSDD